jgi:hypothetical protein
VELTGAQARAVRLRSLLLAPADGLTPPASVADVVTWFGAMQAQDYASGLWSLGVRLPHVTRVDVQQALERREALRTWPMRGTVHLVPPRDVHWMLDLMGVRALAGAATRRASLGLDEAVAEKAVEVLGAALAGGGRMTRAGCIAALEQAGISGAGQRGYHLLWYACQKGVTCIAPHVGTEQTFVLLDEWVPDPVLLDRDEALATIATRFVRSHGPVPRQDLAGWTGLTMADVRRGLDLAGDAVHRVGVDGREMWVAPPVLDACGRDPALDPDAVVALPGYDEYLLGYKDRHLFLEPEHFQAVVPGGNGVFQSTLVRAGRVIGIWKRTTSTRRTVVSVTPLQTLRAGERRRVEAAVQRYADFVGTVVEVRWPS